MAQRLARRVCEDCRIEERRSSETLIDAGFRPDELRTLRAFKGSGCETCNRTGYKGRLGLFEVLEITEGIRDLIETGASAAEIKKKAVEEGVITLQQSGLERVRAGVTTVEEVVRETAL